MLSKIYYKIFENTQSLVGIQLVFTNGFKSPMFETYYGKQQGRNHNRDWPILKTFVIDIDTSQTISQVCMMIKDQKFIGIKLMDLKEQDIAKHIWCTNIVEGNEVWTPMKIPQDQIICGLKCNLSSDDTAIKRLAFNLRSKDWSAQDQ